MVVFSLKLIEYEPWLYDSVSLKLIEYEPWLLRKTEFKTKKRNKLNLNYFQKNLEDSTIYIEQLDNDSYASLACISHRHSNSLITTRMPRLPVYLTVIVCSCSKKNNNFKKIVD